MMFSEEPERFWQKYFDCLFKFYKSHDPKDLEPLKDMWLIDDDGKTVHFKTDDPPEEMLAGIEEMMLSRDEFLEKHREEFKRKYSQEIKELTEQYMKNQPKTYKVTIMENKAIRIIEVPDISLQDVLEYWTLVEKFYETREMKYALEIRRKYIVDVNGEIHFPEENPLFILINYDKLKSEIEKLSKEGEKDGT